MTLTARRSHTVSFTRMTIVAATTALVLGIALAGFGIPAAHAATASRGSSSPGPSSNPRSGGGGSDSGVILYGSAGNCPRTIACEPRRVVEQVRSHCDGWRRFDPASLDHRRCRAER